ncbi:MAG TPA: MgtC/SapB family protein [Anaerolineae bacterium]
MGEHRRAEGLDIVEQTALFYRFGVALFIGILVGMQRQYAEEPDQDEIPIVAGVRTFALLGLVGATAALAADLLGSPWIFVGIVLALGVLIAVAYVIISRHGDPGMTTEVAAVLVVLAGALAYWEQVALAVALGVTTFVLLSLKFELHRFAERITREDILATLKFAVITAIVLPVLPNQPVWDQPPFDVLNPYRIWLMVVLISGISFLGYVLIKIAGPRRGISLTGILGGLASSTATTLSFAQRSGKNVELGRPFALAILLAWTLMFVRILVEVGAVYAPLLANVWLPIVAAAVAGLAYCAYLYFGPHEAADEEDVRLANPFELGPALTFGLLYGVILLVARAAEFYFGDTGVYISSIVSGLADVDAITLSMAQLSSSGNLELPVAARAIVLAAMSNTVVKGGIVLSSGSSGLRRAILPGFLLILATGTVLAFLV